MLHSLRSTCVDQNPRSCAAPIREVNRQFIRHLVAEMPLRPEVDPQMAARYLESVEYFFQSVMRNYQGGRAGRICTPCLTAGEILDMVLFGIMRQSEAGAPSPSA